MNPLSTSDSDFISPRNSAEYVMKNAKNVSIDSDAVQQLAQRLTKDVEIKGNLCDWKKHELHPKEANNASIDWIFVVDCLNFSFWPQVNCEYSINGYTGYYALCAAINRAIQQSIPIIDPKFYANLSEQQLKDILRTDNGIEMPLINERFRVLTECGKVLNQKFNSSFVNCVQQSNSNALNLLKLIIDSFPSFRDQAIYCGQKVSFYKRAQILIADIWGCFEGKDLGFFQDIEELTMFADYRVPQVLAYFGAIKYSNELLILLNKKELINYGSDNEVEIRSASIHAIELIREQIKSNNSKINSIILDFYLWDYRRKNSKEIEEKIPFHRCRSIYY